MKRLWERLVDGVLTGGLLGMAAYALVRFSDEVRDGAGYVTTASNVAWAIFTVLALLFVLRYVRMPIDLKRTIRWAASIAVAFHALGLLAGLYASVWWYDDALHVSYGMCAAVLIVRVMQLNAFPVQESTPFRAALLGFVVALAVAAGWEIFEYVVGAVQASRLQADLDDTMLDMIDGAFGGIVAAGWLAMHPTRGDDGARMPSVAADEMRDARA